MPLPTVRIEDLERLAIDQALTECRGCVTAAAKRLGMGKTTLYRKLSEYEVQDVLAVKRSAVYCSTKDSQNGSVGLSRS